MRRALAAAGLAITVLAIPLPANAKGFSVARFTGPGLPAGGVSVNGERNPIWQLGLDSPKVPGPAARGIPRKKLGPAYHGRFRTDWAPHFLLVQVVYPYAPRGPWTYTPPHQQIARCQPTPCPLPAGWYHGKPRLLRFLIASGFPAAAPVATTDAPAAARRTESSPPDPDGVWPAWAWILIAVGIGGAALLFGWTHRRRPAPL